MTDRSMTQPTPETAVLALARDYPAGAEEVWGACTDPERLPRWFSPVTGDLREGGTYAIEGNAHGSILSCERPRAFVVTWEIGEATSTVTVRLEPLDPERTRLVLEHDQGAVSDHWQQYGPAATGLGWDWALHGLEQHLAAPEVAVEREAAFAWMGSEAGRVFFRASADAWRDAHLAAGGDPEFARASADASFAAYTGG